MSEGDIPLLALAAFSHQFLAHLETVHLTDSSIMFARYVSRTLIRRSELMMTGVRHANVTRAISAPSVRNAEEPAPESADLIRDCIKGLMEKQRDVAALKPITDAKLQQRLQAFQVSQT